ncbi:MAG: DUF5615 family PIN-like protein [Opitutae bacterium]|nr:DUF5615 family PIN-like protein [Opitutae bacterium]
MKLLLDENLPPSLAKAVDKLFPGSVHVEQCGLGSTDDTTDNLNRLLRQHADTIAAFGQNRTEAILEIARTIP